MARSRRARKTSPKLLAVDLDGTLLDARTGRPHARDLAALHALAASGVPLSIVTGRLYSGTQPTAELLGVRGPVACVDGSHLVSARDHATLVHHGIRGAHAHHVRDALARSGAATFVFSKNTIVHDEAGVDFLGYVATWSTEIQRTDVVASHAAWDGDDGITAVVAVGTGAQIEHAVVACERTVGDAAQVATFPVRRLPGMWGLVLRAAGGSKGSALRWIAAHHGVDIEETVCVGDWLNDIPMLEIAGRSFAMGQAPDEVKAAATDLLAETGETGGGVARVVEEAFGIAVGPVEPDAEPAAESART